jgi:SAM-dependent MidA family methyltransferase
VQDLIKQHIIQNKAPIGFDTFMELALYHPKGGYYRSNKPIFGTEGDFITAPETSVLFGWTLAKHCLEVFQHTENNILEFGAGSGVLASQIIEKLPELETYFILELSGHLKQIQLETIKEKCPESLDKVVWLTALPTNFKGIVIANEVLDAIPTKRFEFSDKTYELKVNENLEWQKVISEQKPPVKISNSPYQTEINFMIKPWLKSIVDSCEKAHILLIDYGYAQSEYYHPQRTTGTFRCYHKHQVSENPFINIGKQDITSSVDFTALTNYGLDLDLELAGWTTQAHFLISLEIEAWTTHIKDEFKKMSLIQEMKQLLLPSAMGETFKVIGFNKGLSCKYSGFQFDLSHKL